MLVYAGGQGVNLGDLPAGSIVGQVVNLPHKTQIHCPQLI